MYKIVIRNKEGKILFIGNTHDMLTNIRYSKHTKIIADVKINFHYDKGYTIEFFNFIKGINFTYFKRTILQTTKDNIILSNPLPKSSKEYLELLDKYKIEYRLSKLNKVI